MDKKEEKHSMEKPKPLEVVSDGDLSEIKKDPVWKSWLKEKDALDPKAGPRPTDPEYKGKRPMGYKHTGGRTESGKLKPSKIETHMGLMPFFPMTIKPHDISDSVAGGQSHGEQSTRARDQHHGRKERDQSMLHSSDQGYNESQGTALKNPKKFRSGHQPMDTWSSGIDTKYHHDPLSDPTKRGGKNRHGKEPEDKMTRTIPEKVIPEKEVSILPKGGKSPKIKKAWEVWLEKKISEPDPIKDAPDPNRSIIGAKDEEDYKRRKQGLGGKGGCRGVGCDKKATKKLIAWVRDHEAGTTPEKPILSDRMHKEIINVCPDCHKRALDIKERDEKKIQEDANKTYVTKPIPDSKGGKGSFQHCINTNQDKNNPGGWCKQIERKVEGKNKGERKITDPLNEKNCPYCDGNYKSDVSSSGMFEGGNKQPHDDQYQKVHEQMKRVHDQNPEHFHVAATSEEGIGIDDPIPDKTKEALKAVGKCTVCGEHKHRAEMENPLAQRFGICDQCFMHRQRDWEDRDPDAERENVKHKADYFVEEIRANIIYHNKIFPLVGMIAGAAGKVGAKGAKIGGEILDDMGDMTKEEGQ